jgi:tetratricopeptide (TPR) repeat protein
MKSRKRAVLMLWLALVGGACFAAPALAQKNDAVARSAQIAELSRAGNYSEALLLAQRLLADMEKAYGPVHRDVAAALNNLALLYGDQGNDVEAEPLYKRAIEIQEKVFGLDSSEIAPELNNLAALYQRQERYPEAEPLIKRSLAIREKMLGPDHPDVARSLNNLADLYEWQGRYADAQPLYQRALSIREQAVGPDHPDTATSLNNLASFYQAQDRTADALPIVERTIASGHAQARVALSALSAAERQQLLPTETALDQALNMIQRGAQSSAASAVNKLAVRLAAGNDRRTRSQRSGDCGDPGAVVRRRGDGAVRGRRQGELRLCDHPRGL